MESRKLTLKIVVALAAMIAFGAPRAEAIPPGFKPCVQYCPTTPPSAYTGCWWHCYLEWCKSNVPPQYRVGCHTVIFQPGSGAGLLVRDPTHLVGYELTDSGVAYFDFTGRPDVHLSATDLRSSSNPAQSITVWYLPGGVEGAEWTQVGKGSPSAAGDWDLLLALDSKGDRSPTGTLAFEVSRPKVPSEDFAFALCPVLHAPKVTFGGLSHYALGAATISVEDDGTGERRLPVSNLGSSGQDGVSIDLGSGSSRFRPAFFDIFFDLAPVQEPDAALNIRVAQGDVTGDGVEDVLAHAQAQAEADGARIKVRFPWLPAGSDVTRTLELFEGDQRVGLVEGVHGDEVGRSLAAEGSAKLSLKDIHINFDPFYIELTWTGSPSTVLLRGAPGTDLEIGGQVHHCDRLRISPDGVKPPRSKLSSFVMTASGISSITVNEEGVRSSPPVDLGGLAHNALGNAELAIQDDGTGERRLPVSNLGSSGQDGVSIDLGSSSLRHRPAFFDIFVEPVSFDWKSSQMQVSVLSGDLDGDGAPDIAAQASCQGTDSGIELRGSFPWAASEAPVSLSYYSGKTLVGTSKTTNGKLAGVVVADPAEPTSFARPLDFHIEILPYEPWIIIKITWTGSGSSTARGAGGSTGAYVLIDGEVVHIDRLDMAPEGSSLEGLVDVDSFELTGSDLPEIVITGENYGELIEEPLFRRGDANGDSHVDIGDPIFLLGYLFSGSKTPACMDAADVNDTGKVDLSDPISALNYLFLGSKAPPAPGTSTCGADPTDDTLKCGEYSACP